MKATYNITNDRLCFWPDERLSEEKYKEAKSHNFQRWPSRKCFSAVWSSGAEDFISSFKIEIEEDDTPDDLEGRVERFSQYAEKSESEAESATERALEATTERRARLATRTAEREADQAIYWQRRIASAIRHAAMKDNPGVIARRIKGIESDLRKWGKWEDEFLMDMRGGWIISYWAKERGVQWGYPYPELTEEQKADFKQYATRQKESKHQRAQRWINHIQMRLEYERAYLESVGGSPAQKLDALNLKEGDKVIYAGKEYEVVKINRQTVKIKTSWGTLKVDKTALKPVPEGEA